MAPWFLAQDQQRGWVLKPSEGDGEALRPEYRGAFEDGELPPKRVRITSGINENGTAAVSRFRAGRSPGRRRSFGVCVHIAPEVWEPAGSRKGWHFFSGDNVFLGLWSSLPATWLAQDNDGAPLPPPWRELWTFGTDHLWVCRIGDSRNPTVTGIEAFRRTCLESNPEGIPRDV